MSDEDPARYLLTTDDAMVWAEEFCRTFAGCTIMPNANVANMVDEGRMVAWFASAIETAKTLTAARLTDGE